MIALAIFFFVTALLYASVGFGGGSTYSALLVLNETDYRILPSISLVCNLIVVAGGTWRFAAAGHLNFARIAPFVAASAPLAFIGGRIPVSEILFTGLLGASLAAAGARMLVKSEPPKAAAAAAPALWLAVPTGAAIGLLSGVVGIGGGIFLAPVLHLLRWDTARAIAGACSFFILVNSLFGLAGQLARLQDLGLLAGFAPYWPLFPAVLIGGQIGSRLGSSHLSEPLLRRLTALLVLYVAVRLLLRWLQMATA
jgi:hypothetical protein